MLVEGKYTSANILTDDVEDHAVAQIQQLCDLENMKDSTIVCMPDIHVGKVSTIGFTCTQLYSSPIMPSLVGNDIGCSVTLAKLLTKKKPDFQKLDVAIRENIPTGDRKRNKLHPYYEKWYNTYNANQLTSKMDIDWVGLSLGTLGGGNHFIELDIDDNGDYYIAIHSGSRSLGGKSFEYWIDIADKETNPEDRIVPRELTYLSSEENKRKYISDVQLCRSFAQMSHRAIIDDICKAMRWDYEVEVQSIHNIISDNEDSTYTIRKGAIEAKAGDRVIVPINMKDGIIVGSSKGNPEYNMSAPHGAGRILARKEVANHHTLNEYKKEMQGIHSPTICKATLDEAPFAYRSIERVLPKIENIITIEKIIKPVYNYKDDSKDNIRGSDESGMFKAWAKYNKRPC